jgi:uncharacterized membrane protein
MPSNRSKNALNKKYVNTAVIILVMAAAITGMVAFRNSITGTQPENNTGNKAAGVVKDSDLIIKTSDISETARFYPVEIEGTELEVLAVKAPDGTIRTAFNTCQVCYSSGRGYYVQEGDVLVCQNCGNRFKMSEVEVTKGGCNPVPITSSGKTVSDAEIVISADYMTEAKTIFANWKR